MLESGASISRKAGAALADILQRAFWDSIGALEIVIDLALIAIPVFVLWKIQTSWGRKSAIIFAFAIRAM